MKDWRTMNDEGGMSQQRSQSGPRILLADSNRWPLTARMAAELAGLGAQVGVLCPTPGHPVRVVPGVRVFRYDGRRPVASLRTALESFEPALVIPACDRSVEHLHTLHDLAQAVGSPLAALIEHSLGPAESFPIVASRYDLLMLAAAEGIRVPESIRIDSREDVSRWEGDTPWLLKANGTWGGHGVRDVTSPASAREAFDDLTSRAGVTTLLRNLFLNRGRDWTWYSWKNIRPGIVGQALVHGRPANCSVVCWQGEVLAAIAVEVVLAEGPRQPAAVVRIVDGPEMISAARRIAARLRLSGFFGLDFMIDDSTGASWLIEMNPRCTPPCTMPLGAGRDLVAALWATVAGCEQPRREPATTRNRVAYFPAGPAVQSSIWGYAGSAWLDVPQNQPELIDEILHPWSCRSAAGALLDALRRQFGTARTPSACLFDGVPREEPGLVINWK